MNTMKAILLITAAVVLTASTLLYNRSSMQARARKEEARAFPVTVATVTTAYLQDSLSLVGTVHGANDVAVVSETQGKVLQTFADVGDVVRAGDVIAAVDDKLKQAAFAAAEVTYVKAKKDLDRYTSLSQEQSISDSQLESARMAFQAAEAQYVIARRELENTRIKSPINGTMTSLTIERGTMVMPGMLIANVVDIRTLKITLNVSERAAFALSVGQGVGVTTDIYPDARLEGRVKSISAKADESHTYPVQITLANSSRYPLKAGMFARVWTLSKSAAKELVIPRASLIGSIKQPQVFVVENGVARLQDIGIREQSGTQIQVTKGLREGDVVVQGGQNILRDGSAVAIVQQ